MRRVTTTIAIASVILTLAACGGGGDATGTKVTVTTTQTVISAGAPSSEEPTSSATSGGPVSLGQKVFTKFAWLKVRKVEPVSSDNRYINQDAGAGNTWMGILADGCMLDSAPRPRISISWVPWSLQGPHGELYDTSSSSWDDFPPAPQYPQVKSFVRGDCWTGWMLVSVPDGAKISAVRYDNGQDFPSTWQIS